MQIVRFSSLDPLVPQAARWDNLAGDVPFRRWAWLSAWWRHYAPRRRPGEQSGLYVLGAVDAAGELVGVAPWHLEYSPARGRVLRWLGSGEVCSDYLSVLCRPEREEEVAESLADWLMAAHDGTDAAPHGWDLLRLDGVDAEDSAVRRLAAALEARDATVHRQPGPCCWRVPLPGTWQEYLAMLSKNHRKQVRRIDERLWRTGRAVLRTVDREEQLAQGESVLVHLHQRRRQHLGEPGRFASTRFAAFHHEVMQELLKAGRLGLHWIELDGVPVAAEYHLHGAGVVYAYQSGVDPDALEGSPGALAHTAVIRRAIEQGYRGFDFLRGDEPYKGHWRAGPRPTLEIQIVPPRTSARMRHGIWQAGRGVKRWLEGNLKRAK